MDFHLPSMPGVLLTVGRNVERHAKIKEFLGLRGYSGIRWNFGKPTKNHHKGAKEAAIEVLRSSRCPFLWLEDDAATTEHYCDTVSVPDRAQVAYLGGSRLGFWKPLERTYRRRGLDLLDDAKLGLPHGRRIQDRRLVYADTDDRAWVRVLTMFSGHAIIWIDDAVREEAADIMERSRETYDFAWARHQWQHKVYCLRHPYFYQDDGHHACTVSYCPP